MITDQHWMYYGTRDLQMVPMMPGTPIYKDGVLSSLYYRTKSEGNLERVFDEELNHDRFIAFFERIKTLQVLCEVEDNKDLKPAGYCWVCNPIGADGARAALCGFCMFGDSGKTHVARDLAMLGIAYWIKALKIDVLHGVILADNWPARNFAANLGFVKTAEVPKWRYVGGELVDVVNYTLYAENFLPTFEGWRVENPMATPE